MTAPIAPTTPAVETPVRTGPLLSPIQQAAQAAREQLAAGTLTLPGSLATKPATTVSIPGVTAEPTPPVVPDIPAESAGEAGEASEPVDIGEDKPAEEAGEAGEAPTSFTVLVPNNRPGLPDLELEVPDQHTADVLGMLKNGFIRGEDYRAEMSKVEELQDDLETFKLRLESDPIGFVQEHIPQQAKMMVVMDLVADPELFPDIVSLVKNMVQNPEKLETLRARMEGERYKLKDNLTREANEKREIRQNASELMAGINKLVPGNLDAGQAAKLIAEARSDVAEYATRHNLRTLPVTDLPVVLAQRLLAYGIDPVQAAARMAGKAATNSSPQTGQPSVGVKLKEASDRRKAAAVAAPSGISTPATETRRPPKGMTIAQAAQWAKENLYKGS